MAELIPILASFLLIPLLSKIKLKLSHTLLISAGVLGILSGIGFQALGRVLASIIVEASSRNTVLTVIMVGILGGLMKHYGFLDKIVEIIMLLIRNQKNALTIIPAMVGILIIPGGALLSAPFVNDIGKEMEIPAPRRAAINLAFRHLSMFLMPYSTVVLIVFATMPQLSMPRLISMNLSFVISIITIGYFFFLRDVKSNMMPPRKNVGRKLGQLALYTSPIYIAVIINGITGWPFYVTLLGSILIIYFLSPKEGFINVIINSINWDTVLTVIGALLIKETILNMEGLIGVFQGMFNEGTSMLSTLGVLMLSSIFFGYITGNNTASLAIVLPMLSQAFATSPLIYVYTYFAMGSSFLGYYFSPVHLCQAFTLDHMGVTTGDLYREYRYYAPTLLLTLVAFTLIFRMMA